MNGTHLLLLTLSFSHRGSDDDNGNGMMGGTTVIYNQRTYLLLLTLAPSLTGTACFSTLVHQLTPATLNGSIVAYES